MVAAAITIKLIAIAVEIRFPNIGSQGENPNLSNRPRIGDAPG